MEYLSCTSHENPGRVIENQTIMNIFLSYKKKLLTNTITADGAKAFFVIFYISNPDPAIDRYSSTIALLILWSKYLKYNYDVAHFL